MQFIMQLPCDLYSVMKVHLISFPALSRYQWELPAIPVIPEGDSSAGCSLQQNPTRHQDRGIRRDDQTWGKILLAAAVKFAATNAVVFLYVFFFLMQQIILMSW